MKGSEDSAFKQELKAFIIEACEKEVGADAIADDAPLFGPESPLEFDSIDGLQLSVAIERRFGIKITDAKVMRRTFTSINALADFLRPE